MKGVLKSLRRAVKMGVGHGEVAHEDFGEPGTMIAEEDVPRWETME